MQNLIFLTIFLTGLTVGSFLNCLIHRLSKNEGFFIGRSHCPNCHHLLIWQDLIPVLSFLILKGKCRYCQKPISWQYPLVELVTGLLFVLIFNFQFFPISSRILDGKAIGTIFNQFSIFQFSNLIYYFIISGFLIIIFVYDFKHYIIPDKVIYPAILLTLILNFKFLIFNQFLIFNFLILSAIGAALFFLLIVLVSRGKWMGLGDVKLAFLMGLLLGFPNILVALFLAFFIGAIIGVGLIAIGKKTLKSEIPFGPFLVIGTFIALFWGRELINWYLNIFI